MLIVKKYTYMQTFSERRSQFRERNVSGAHCINHERKKSGAHGFLEERVMSAKFSNERVMSAKFSNERVMSAKLSKKPKKSADDQFIFQQI